MRSFRSRTLALIGLVAAVVVLTFTNLAFAVPRYNEGLTFGNHGVLLENISAAPGDTQRVVARWGAASDANGAADSYRVRWTYGTATGTALSVTRTVTLLQDILLAPLPALPDSLGVTVVIRASRRGLLSRDSVWGSKWFARPDVPPPPPGPVIIDTLAVRFDSVAVLTRVAGLVTYDPRNPNSRVGSDTTTVCAFARGNGNWYEAEYSAVVQAPDTTRVVLQSTKHLDTAGCSKVAAARGFPFPVVPGQYAPVQWTTPSGGSSGGGGSGLGAALQLRLPGYSAT